MTVFNAATFVATGGTFGEHGQSWDRPRSGQPEAVSLLERRGFNAAAGGSTLELRAHGTGIRHFEHDPRPSAGATADLQ